MSVSVNVEGLLLVFVQQRYLRSIMTGKVGLSVRYSVQNRLRAFLEPAIKMAFSEQ